MDNQNKVENKHIPSRDIPQNSRNWYDKSFKFILIITLVMIVLSLVYMVAFYHQHNDFIHKDVSLTGGTSITVFDSNISISSLTEKLKDNFPDISIRGISDLSTGKQRGVIIETTANVTDVRPQLEKTLGYSLTTDNSSIEFSGAVLSSGFYAQLRNSLIAAFLLMAWVVFLIFAESNRVKALTTILTGLSLGIVLPEIGAIRVIAIVLIGSGLIFGLWKGEKARYKKSMFFSTSAISLLILFLYPNLLLLIPLALILIALYFIYSIPSFAVILSAFADIIMTIAVVDILGLKLSLAGIIAFLMLIGYSVDTDILLTSRLLRKKEGTVNERTWGAFKTGITMTLTAIAAAVVSLIIIYDFSDTLRQIFTIISIGLFFDIFNTWLTNASLLRWYMEAKKLT